MIIRIRLLHEYGRGRLMIIIDNYHPSVIRC